MTYEGMFFHRLIAE